MRTQTHTQCHLAGVPGVANGVLYDVSDFAFRLHAADKGLLQLAPLVNYLF